MHPFAFGVTFALTCVSTVAQFNNPPGVDIWCGKAYRATNASFNPGGQFPEPSLSSSPLLHLKAAPRMNIYLDDDKIAAFLVNASISHLVGTPIESSGQTGGGQAQPKQLAVEIQLDGKAIGSKEPYSVVVGTPAELPVDISTISAKKEPYTVTIIATSETNQTFSTTTELIKLPLRTDNGTAVRIDNLYGGLGLRKASDSSWQPFYPYTYYVQWDRYFNTSPSTLETFSDMGYNVIHIVPTGSLGQSPFPRDEFQPFLDKAAELGLLLHYDVLFLEKGLANMTEQVQWLESHPSILSWYIADEPDGKSVLPSKLREGYERIRSLDLYHPVSLALNCYDFYYEEYASGADIVLSDVYPISTNTSYSTVYNTTCNATYGCCGCDDCHGSFEDVSVRLDNFARIDDLIGWPKIHWNVPQAFGSPSFWTRNPTAAEEVVMNLLGINHAAKGSILWEFPTTPEILAVTNKLANILTSSEVVNFLLKTPRFPGLAVQGADRIDAAAWVDDATVLVIAINLNYGDTAGGVTVTLPEGVQVTAVKECLWGSSEWTVGSGGRTIQTQGLMGLEASMIVLTKG